MPTDPEARTVYVTAQDTGQAKDIARTVIEERLAACANILGPMTSLYRWQGVIQEDAEVALLLKTRRELVPRLIERVRALHSYEVPCIVSWPIEEANKAYLAWIQEETSP